MEEQITKLTTEFNNLKELFEIAYDAAKFNINAQWIMITILITIGGTIAYSLIKKWFDKAIDEKANEITNKIKEQGMIIEKLNNNLIVIRDNYESLIHEIGNWTPYFIEGHHKYFKQEGKYSRNGYFIALSFELSTSKTDLRESGFVSIGGLPFVSGEGKTVHHLILRDSETLEMPTRQKDVYGVLLPNSNRIDLYYIDEERFNTYLKYSALNNTVNITGTIIFSIE